MEKKEVISQLRKAKTAHIRWRSYAQALVAGVPMDEGKVPVIHTDCEFGRWYFGEGQALADLPGFRAINEPHEQLHTVYMEIFKHLFEEENVSLFDRLIGRKAKTNQNRHLAVQSLLDELLRISERLIGHIEELEQAVSEMDEESLAKRY
jgi:hypothetical protein